MNARLIAVIVAGAVLIAGCNRLLARKKASPELAAIADLQTIEKAEELYAVIYKAEDKGFASLRTLADEGLVDRVLGSGRKSGYYFEIKVDGATYEAFATPI
ncbi:MAG TPA: hypothetical protein VFV34_20515, partial [Blastocatellia bacterium]|nr:hypothetical protein [Blastocatellia bacterium]